MNPTPEQLRKWQSTTAAASTEQPTAAATIKAVEDYIRTYATLQHDYYLLPLALWALATHTWPTFDCFPYLVITAYVKRAGKTRLMELLTMISSNGKSFSPDSAASMFRSLKEDKPSMFLDEAEKLNQEQHPAREFLNKGYKRGQTISRFIGNEVVDFECYCPKCFVLIGDVYDTLRDRCIMVTMRRRTPVESASENKFRRATVEPQAEALRGQMHALITNCQADIENSYATLNTLAFLNDRDEELWTPLFALARVLCPERLDELTKASVDIATEKTGKRRAFTELMEAEEDKADAEEARILLLRDMLALTADADYISTIELLEKLKAIPTSPWRMFKGVGLTAQDISSLLNSMRVGPKVIRVKSGQKTKNAFARGYRRDDLLAAAKLVGFPVHPLL